MLELVTSIQRTGLNKNGCTECSTQPTWKIDAHESWPQAENKYRAAADPKTRKAVSIKEKLHLVEIQLLVGSWDSSHRLDALSDCTNCSVGFDVQRERMPIIRMH